ncbi:hypothetical protein PS639_04939 [Pseudomonas fluorescens]|nr:hypothetical protein PS639_04939 [Pseudomonas fluorescens]
MHFMCLQPRTVGASGAAIRLAREWDAAVYQVHRVIVLRGQATLLQEQIDQLLEISPAGSFSLLRQCGREFQ